MRVFDSLNDKTATLLMDGAIGLIPTDTLYCVACQAINIDSVSRVHELNKRFNNPETIIAASIDQLVELGFKKRYLRAVEEFWPGPISVMIPYSSGLDYLNFEGKLSSARLPSGDNLNSLLNKTGPLLTVSAVRAGLASIVNVDEVIATFQDELDFCVDGGDYTSKQPAAIVRIIDDAVEVISPGYGWK